jgi:hypothetical protein
MSLQWSEQRDFRRWPMAQADNLTLDPKNFTGIPSADTTRLTFAVTV